MDKAYMGVIFLTIKITKRLLLFVLFIVCPVLWLYPSQKPVPNTWTEALREQLGAPEYESVDKDKPLDEQVAIVEIGGRTFAIPKVYIQTNLKGRHKVTGLNLLYVMPDFTSRAEFKRAFNNRRMASMLIEDAVLETPIVEIIKNKKKYGHFTKFEGMEYGLEKHIDFNDPRHVNIKYDDTYLEKSVEGKVISFLRCSPDGKVRFPGCGHDFDNNNLRYGISFNKEKYFSTWQEHRRKAIEFIDSFEIKPKNINTEQKRVTP